MYKCKFVLILFLISFPFFSYSHEGATGIVKERMDKFQESKNLMRTINKSLSDKHQINIRAKLIDVPNWLAMGSYCVVNLTIGKPRPVILVPLTAVEAQSSVNKVFVVKNNIVEERLVTLGAILENGKIEILSGISDKEEIIVLGGFKVYNGMEVTIK